MEKDQIVENLSLNGRKEERLEISSTGYGLESVTTTAEAQEQDTEKELNEK